MFLVPVDEREVIDIVNKCSNKRSTDFNDIDMTLVKKTIEGISEPLTSVIYHFKRVHFPAK